MGAGARGFGEEYWRTAYAAPGQIDGTGNAHAHAAYLHSLLFLDMAPVSSIVDLGAGLGGMLHAMIARLQPARALAVEPSAWALERLARQAPAGTELRVTQADIASWCTRPGDAWTYFDLGLCTSVLQYLDDDEIAAVIPELARRVRWLYLTVPTSREFAGMRAQTGFADRWAIARPATWYRSALSPHFRWVSSRLLESRRVPEAASPFTEELYRLP